jgi:hypothetical protein
MTRSGLRQWLRWVLVPGLAAGLAWGQEALLGTGTLGLGFSEAGGFRCVESPTAAVARGPELLRSGGLSWALGFVAGSGVTAEQFLQAPWSGKVSAETAAGRLVQRWESPGLTLEIEAAAQADGIDLRLRVLRCDRAIQRVDFPAALVFDPTVTERVVFPQRAGEGVGVALAGRFFLPHLETPGAYVQRLVGPPAYAALFGAPLRQLDDNEPDVALRVTATGQEWFGAKTTALINSAKACVNRPAAAGQMPVVLVESDSGPAVSASDLGGQGLLLRLGMKTRGQDDEGESRLQQAIVLSATEGLARRHPERFRGRAVAVVALRSGPEQSGWTATSVSQWLMAFRASAVLRQAGARVVGLATPAALRQAWTGSDTALILNPYGEALPTGSLERWHDDIEALRQYVRGGGFWWEVGGYPFFYVLEPQPYLEVTAGYPGCTADFIHLQGRSAGLSLFGVQPLLRQPWEREALVTPAELRVYGTPAGAAIRHSWVVDLPPARPWSSPVLRLMPGQDVRAGLSTYAAAIGLRTPLEKKMSAALLARLKGAVLVFLAGGTAAEQTAALELLPAGSLVHFSAYLKGGFDKQYPDHLPPRASWGSAAELKAFYDRGHALGQLMMPYTNTSWWCIDPKGPTFEREGEEPLSRQRNGAFFKERYAANEGYRVCFWHRAVQEAHRLTRRQMSEEFRSDVLFQDQVGARGWSWDFNPAAPSPTAWIDGLHSLGMEDAAVVPLATEDGNDRVAEFESMLCGMAWGIVPSGQQREAQRLEYTLPPGEWAIFPMMQYLAHDKVLFTLHDLGHFVLNETQLAYVLGLGYGLSYRSTQADLGRTEVREWLAWLDALQKAVCVRYAGQIFTDFQTRGGGAGDLGGPLLLGSYPGLAVAANTGTAAVAAAGLGKEAAWAAAADLDVAGPGFLVSGDRLWAGSVVPHGATDPRRAYGFVLETDAAGACRGVLRAAAGAEVLLPWPGEGSPKLDLTGPDGSVVQVGTTRRGATLVAALPEVTDTRPGARMPATFAGQSPAQWSPWSRVVAVLTLGGKAPTTWVKLTGADWVRVLAEDAARRAAGLSVVEVATAADLRALLRAADGQRPFAVINPGGEYFYAEDAASAESMLDDVRSYVSRGGIWWETGGFSFYVCAYADAQGAWAQRHLGGAGAGRLGFSCAGFPVDAPPEALRVSAAGRAWFNEAVTARIEAVASGTQRGFEDDSRTLTLVAGESGDFAAGSRGDGWGWLLRLGGFDPDPEAAGLIVCGSLHHLATQPWPTPELPAKPRLWTFRTAVP